ncbi:type VI secretion system baseplate subunit TssG [Enterovibrio norvegicus]|uniref:Type VI secretion system protein ImpH n=1 Tax=Enterovibrio norvegicus DSM 15893 TaxID=1121869 RepID=A0A1I5PVE2_9GAMM|nr:type VI secretion system baseplate subunit TssG [Enterovibrio norvegicus]SFP38053.1 type VI secretion system protein ImpH [Enterovibrio norvegicus DSM 15893]
MSRLNQRPVIDLLFEAPYKFTYIQAIRLLNSGLEGSNTKVTSRSALSLAFSANHLESVVKEDDRVEITTNILGLYGIASPLPTFYTEELFEEFRNDETAQRDFLDLLVEPIYKQYFQAWEKYRSISWLVERNDQSKTNHLFSFLGNTHPPPSAQDEFDAFELLPYAGLFTQTRRSAYGLKSVVQELVGNHATVSIYQWYPKWVDVPSNQLCLLGQKNTYLNGGCYLGEQIRDCANNIQIGVTTHDYLLFLGLIPNGDRHIKLLRTLKKYIQEGLDVNLDLRYERLEDTQTYLGDDNSALLGLNSSLGNELFTLNFQLDYFSVDGESHSFFKKEKIDMMNCHNYE